MAAFSSNIFDDEQQSPFAETTMKMTTIPNIAGGPTLAHRMTNQIII
jgi:hypothetical protein